MRSNTASEGCDPAGAFSPAARYIPRPLTGRSVLGIFAAVALAAAAIASAVL